MSKQLLVALAIAVLAVFAVGCAKNDETASANVNAAGTTSVRPGPDNSEITTTTDANGVTTETRVFRDNPRVSKVVVTTTRDGRRTVRVHSRTGDEKEVNDIGDVLEVSGDKLAEGAGWVGDKTEDVAQETKDGAKTVGKEVADKAEDVGNKTAEGAKAVGTGAKAVGKKAASGAKKTGKAIKDALTP